MLEKYKLGEKLLARGAKIIISEPFLKVMADGTVGIRVDDPEKDLIFDQKISELPQTFSELKAEGNKLFMRKDLDGALHCYNRALSCLVLEDNAAYLLLSNLALCCLKLSEFRQALFFGFAASIVGVASDDQIILLKVYFRCHECLVALKELELAGWFSFQLKTIDNVFWQKNMSKLPSADYSSDSAFNGDTDAIICKVFDIVVPPAISFTEVTQHDELFEGKQAVELKQKGNELLKETNYASAKSSYLAALRRSLHRNAYADILRNMSAVYSGLDSPIRSASFALASLCMLPESDKTMFRISRGLLEARCVESAYEFCKAALSKDGENYVLLKVMKDIDIIRLVAPHASQQPMKSGAAYCSEKEINDNFYGAKDSSSLESVRMFNQMCSIAQLSKRPGKADSDLDDLAMFNAEPFHLEYARSGLLPRHCPADACQRKLTEAYELARGFGSHKFSLVSGFIDQNETSLQKRWGPAILSEKFYEWTRNAKNGDVLFIDPKNCRMKYLDKIMQTFSNNVYPPLDVSLGSVHISIGFVDLSSLIYSNLVSVQTKSSSGCRPLQWIGYDLSAYCVAKTMVVAELMRTSTAEVVLQVWYSSAWKQSTQDAFVDAIANIIRSKACTDDEVLSLLSYWVLNKVSLKKSRELWAISQSLSFMNIANCKRQSDRMSLCSYGLSGELLGGDIGSTVMFCIPPGYGDLAMDQV